MISVVEKQNRNRKTYWVVERNGSILLITHSKSIAQDYADKLRANTRD